MTGISKGKISFDKYFLLASKLIFIVDDSPEASH